MQMKAVTARRVWKVLLNTQCLHCKGICHEQMDPSRGCSKEQKCPTATRGAGVDVPEGTGRVTIHHLPQPSFLTAKPPKSSRSGEHEVLPPPAMGMTEVHPGTTPALSSPQATSHHKDLLILPPNLSNPLFFPPKCQAEEQQQSMETHLGNSYVQRSQPAHEYSTSRRGAATQGAGK